MLWRHANINRNTPLYAFGICVLIPILISIITAPKFTAASSLLLISLILFYGPLKKYLPVILLLLFWYVPCQAVPRGLLESYPLIRWLSHMVIPVSAAFFFLRDIARNKSWDLSPFSIPIFSILFIILLSGIYNKTNPLDFVSCILLYLRYPLFFLLLVNLDIDDRALENIVPFFIILTLLQIPEVLYRSLVLGFRGDALCFSLGSYGTLHLGIYCLYLGAFTTSHALETRIKWYHIALLAILFAISGLGEIKALYLFLPLMVLTITLMNRGGFGKLFWRRFLFLSLLAFALFLTLHFWEDLTTMDDFLTRIFSFIQGALSLRPIDDLPMILRVEQIRIVWNMLISSPEHLLLGFGPGSSLAGNFSGFSGILIATFSWLLDDSITINQIAAGLSDFGILGILAFFFLFLQIIRLCVRWRLVFHDLKYRILLDSFLGIFIFYAFLGPFYNLVWRYDSSNFIMWGLLAILYRRYKAETPLDASAPTLAVRRPA